MKKKTMQHIKDCAEITIGCSLLIAVLLSTCVFLKWMGRPYIQPCQEYLKSEYNKNEVPVRCDGFWKQKND